MLVYKIINHKKFWFAPGIWLLCFQTDYLNCYLNPLERLIAKEKQPISLTKSHNFDSYWSKHRWRGSLRCYIVGWHSWFLIRPYNTWSASGTDLQHFCVSRIAISTTWCRYQYPFLYRHVYAQWDEVGSILATTYRKTTTIDHLCRWDTHGAWTCYSGSPSIRLSCILSCWRIWAICKTWTLVCLLGELSSWLWSGHQLCKVCVAITGPIKLLSLKYLTRNAFGQLNALQWNDHLAICHLSLESSISNKR